jgi:endonuclease/exonuclease/phosphatase family metal-dependent hydrolase
MRQVIISIMLFAVCFNAATLRVATYNILNFPDALGTQRLDDLHIVLEYLNPDILVVQEMQNQSGVALLDSVLQDIDNTFTSIPFHDGPGTDNALFYRGERVDYLSAQYHATPNRDIAEYRLLITDTQTELTVFSLHFKASQGASNEAIRLQEATILRNRLNTFSMESDFLVAGDFNIYYSDEPAFGMLTDSLQNNNGRLYDPLSATGYWHANIDFRAVHTQSTRTQQLPDGGAGGGLDDRFDMMLCSKGLLDSTDLFLDVDSYTICGNDGAHFNLSINYGNNAAVPSQIADALYWASDHLPVLVDITDETAPLVEEPLVKVWPNPVEDWAQITFPRHDDFIEARITMTNILGQRVFEQRVNDPYGYRFDRNNLPVGIYFLHVMIETHFNTYTYQTRLAVVK